MKVIVLMIMYILEIIKYDIGYDVCFGQGIKRKWVLVVGMVLGSLPIIFCSKIEAYKWYLLIYLNAICILYFAVVEKGIIKIYRILITSFLITCLDEIWGMLIELVCINLKIKKEYYQQQWMELVISFLTFSVLGVVWFYKKYRKEKVFQKFYIIIREKIQYIVIIMALSILCTIAGLNFTKDYINDIEFSKIAILVCIISYISVGVLGLFALYVRNTNSKMEEMIEQEIALKDMQERYYEALLEKEEDTRKYRHDMMNHFLCLNAFVEEQIMMHCRNIL